jgi:hypothetical protein
MNETLTNKLRELAAARVNLELTKAEAKKLETPEMAAAHELQRAAALLVEQAETSVKELTIMHYLETGEKHPGTKIINSIGVDIDLPAARLWAVDHLPEAIVLDTALFIDYVKKVSKIKDSPIKIPCAKTFPIIKAQVSSDLTAFLPAIPASQAGLTISIDVAA